MSLQIKLNDLSKINLAENLTLEEYLIFCENLEELDVYLKLDADKNNITFIMSENNNKNYQKVILDEIEYLFSNTKLGLTYKFDKEKIQLIKRKNYPSYLFIY